MDVASKQNMASIRAAKQDALIAAVRDLYQPPRRLHRKKPKPPPVVVVVDEEGKPLEAEKAKEVAMKIEKQGLLQPAPPAPPKPVAPVAVKFEQGQGKQNEYGFVDAAKRAGTGAFLPIERNPIVWLIIGLLMCLAVYSAFPAQENDSAFISIVVSSAFNVCFQLAGAVILLSYAVEITLAKIFIAEIASALTRWVLLVLRAWLFIISLNLFLSWFFKPAPDKITGRRATPDTEAENRSWNFAGQLIKAVGSFVDAVPNSSDSALGHAWKGFWIAWSFVSSSASLALGSGLLVGWLSFVFPQLGAFLYANSGWLLPLGFDLGKQVGYFGYGNYKAVKKEGYRQVYGALEQTGYLNLATQIVAFATLFVAAAGAFYWFFPNTSVYLLTKATGLQSANDYYILLISEAQRRLDLANEKPAPKTTDGKSTTDGQLVVPFTPTTFPPFFENIHNKIKETGGEDQSALSTVTTAVQLVVETVAGTVLKPPAEKIREGKVLAVIDALSKLLPLAGVCDREAARVLLLVFPNSELSGSVGDVWSSDNALMRIRAASINAVIASKDGLLAAKISEVNRSLAGIIPRFWRYSVSSDLPLFWLETTTYLSSRAKFSDDEWDTISEAVKDFDGRIEKFYSFENISKNKLYFNNLGFNTSKVEEEARTKNAGAIQKFAGMDNLRYMVGFQERVVDYAWDSENQIRIREDLTKPVNEQMGILVSILSGSGKLAPGGSEYCSSFSETPWILGSGIGMARWRVERAPMRTVFFGLFHPPQEVRPGERLKRKCFFNGVYYTSLKGVCTDIEEEPGADPVEYCWENWEKPESVNMYIAPVVKISDET